MEKNLAALFEHLYDLTRDITGVGVWYYDVKLEELFWDTYTKKIHQVEQSYRPTLQKAIDFYREGKYRDSFQRLIDECVQNQTSFQEDLGLITANGKEINVRVVGKAHTAERVVVGVYGTLSDITEEFIENQKNLFLRERLELATEAGGIGIWDWDVQNNVLSWDDRMYALYGVKKSDFSGAYDAWQKGLHPNDVQENERLIKIAFEGGRPFESTFRVVWPSGEIRFIKAKSKIFWDEAGVPIRMLGTNWDVTEEILSQVELKDYAYKMKIVQDAIQVALWKWYPDTNLAIWDDELYDMYSIPKNVKDPVTEWEKCIDPDLAKEVWGELKLCMEGKKPYDKVYKVTTLSGVEKFVRGKAAVVRKSDGSIDYLLGVNMDVTEDMAQKSELEKQNKELVRLSERLKESNEQLEEFAYVASHDLKSPIRNMSNIAVFLKEDFGSVLGEEGNELLSKIQEQSSRMTELVNDLLSYSRVNKVALELYPIPLKEVITGALDFLDLKEDPTIQLEIADLPEFKIDPIKMREVFNNLFTNSIKYNENHIKKISVWEENNVVYFQDNGIGIDVNQKEKVFAFFSRLHAKEEYGGGTGAGMAIVKKVLDRHNATIDFISEIGKGTTFKIDFSNCLI